jgi:hypothetical protein
MNIPTELQNAEKSAKTSIAVEEATFAKMWAQFKAQTIAVFVAGALIGYGAAVLASKIFH